MSTNDTYTKAIITRGGVTKQYTVRWSTSEGGYIAECPRHPDARCIEADPDTALAGIIRLVQDIDVSGEMSKVKKAVEVYQSVVPTLQDSLLAEAQRIAGEMPACDCPPTRASHACARGRWQEQVDALLEAATQKLVSFGIRTAIEHDPSLVMRRGW